MRVLSNSEIDRAEWSALVWGSETGNWFQTPEAYEFFAGQPELFAPLAIGIVSKPEYNSLPTRGTIISGTMNEERLRGVCVGYVTVEKSLFKQFLTRRAIIIGGPCFADDVSSEEVELLMNGVKELMTERINGAPIYIETRNFNDYSKWRGAFEAAGFDYVPHLNFHVDTSSVEVVEANMGKNRKRDIKTSFRDGAVVIEHPTIEQVRQYYAILENLYRTKVKTPLFPLSFFEALYHHPDGRFILVGLPNAEEKTEIIGGTVCVEYAGKCVYEWFVSGRDGEWKSVFPSSVATYAGIRYAAEHNCPRFDMMGAGTPDEAYGVRDFKARFGGKEVEYGRFLCITKPLLYRIGVLGVKLLKRFK